MEMVWVSLYWDGPREGLCRVGGELLRFATCPRYVGRKPWLWLFRLSWHERLRWLAMKALFELCVGRHWTYPDRANGAVYRERRPKWLHRLAFSCYYAAQRWPR